MNIDLQTILSYKLGTITTKQIAISVGIFIGLLIIFSIFRAAVLKNLKKLARKTKTDFDDLLIKNIENIPQHFYWLTSTFIAFQFLGLSDPKVKKIVNGIFIVFVIYRAVIFVQGLIEYSLKKFWARDEKQAEENQTAIHGVQTVAKIILWSAGLLLILSNLGFEVTTLVASLGIGGIAVAFALQNVLGDLFSSFAIYFDQPFKIGDYIEVGTDGGTVKKIGLKTTRIQTLRGDELVISNAELTNTRIHNFKRMRRRRIVFNIGVTYDTGSMSLKKIPGLIRKIIEKVESADFERCHFKEFGDFSLNFEITYYVKNREYPQYLDTQQEINLGIKEKFDKEKIEMAFPTQTIQVQNNGIRNKE